MSQVATVTGLAIRELWISFRLIALLVVCVGAGASVALLPGSLAGTLERLALGLAMAVATAAGVAGWSMAIERTTGRAGWLVGRSVTRWTLLGGWFVALGIVVALGVVVAIALGWVTMTGFTTRPAPGTLVALAVAIVGWAGAAVSIGLLAGALLTAPVAAVLAAALALAAGLAPWIAPGGGDLGPLVPGAGIGLLAAAAEAGPLVGPALQAAGLGLATAAIALVLARLALDRTEL